MLHLGCCSSPRSASDVNSVASKILGRSLEAIQKIRTKPEHKLVEKVVKKENSVEQKTVCVKQSPQLSPFCLSCVEETPQPSNKKKQLSVEEENPHDNVEQTPLPSVDIHSVNFSAQHLPLCTTRFKQFPWLNFKNNSSSTPSLNSTNNFEQIRYNFLSEKDLYQLPLSLLFSEVLQIT